MTKIDDVNADVPHRRRHFKGTLKVRGFNADGTIDHTTSEVMRTTILCCACVTKTFMLG